MKEARGARGAVDTVRADTDRDSAALTAC